MEILNTPIPDVKIMIPKAFEDERGFFLESYNEKTFEAAFGTHVTFVQDNHSKSKKNVLRGLHYQILQPQGKLVRVVCGEVYDVAVDLRKTSATFGKWFGTLLTAANRHILWIPPGFAHGFLALSESAELLYKASDFYEPSFERCLRWDDPDLGIKWPLPDPLAGPILSVKDKNGRLFKDLEGV